jgi:hypothetical protein
MKPMRRFGWLIAGMAFGTTLNVMTVQAATPYAEAYARATGDECVDAGDQAGINRCSVKLGEELLSFERQVQQAARDSVVKSGLYPDEDTARYAMWFDQAAKEWRKAVEDECAAEGVAMHGTGSTQKTWDCIFDRTDHHIRSLIQEYDLKDQFGPLPASNH